MYLKYLGFKFACLMLQSSTIMASSIIVPFIKPMLLGRTFDYSMSKVGEDIFPASVRNNPVTTSHDKCDVKYKITRSAKDVRDVLDVSSQLSLQVMAGLLDIKGKGSYLKESSQSGNFVQVLARINCETVTKTITTNMKPNPGWDKESIVGKHYVRSITYGGFLIASLKFHSKNENKENIEATVDANLKTGKFEVGVKGQFKKLASSVKDISTLTISYTATAPLTTVATDIDSLLKAIDDFPSAVNKINGGIGVPIEAEIFELNLLSNNPKLTFLIDGVTQTKLADLESFYYDLRTTSDAIKKFLQENQILSKDAEKKIGVFYNNIFKITETFNALIASIDLNKFDIKATDQFKKAFDAYRGGGILLPNKFLRKYKALIATINPVKSLCGKGGINREAGNIAIGKQTAQSSTTNEGHSRHAVDGSKDSTYLDRSCTHTDTTDSPWWRVDLGSEHTVISLNITNRGDCCANRLSGFEIRIGNSLQDNGNQNPKCAVTYSSSGGRTRQIICPLPLKGRYVNIRIPGSNKILTLCEVEIFE